MLFAEIRYLGSALAVIALVAVPLVASTTIGKSRHLPFAAVMVLFVALLCTLGYVTYVLWCRTRKRFVSATPALYAPLVFPLAVLGLEARWILESIPPLNAATWHDDTLVIFASQCFSAGIFASYTLKDWQSRYLQKAPEPAVAPRHF